MRIGLAATIGLLALGGCNDRDPPEATMTVPPYGVVHVIRHNGVQSHTVVMFSGTEGWTPEMSSRAWGVSWPDRLVIGIDTAAYLNAIKPTDHAGAVCVDYSGQLSYLVRTVAETVHDPLDPAPLLIGKADGGTIALLAGAQSPPTSVDGVIAEDFCPRIAAVPCPGAADIQVMTAADGKTQTLTPPKGMHTPFIAITDADQCTATDVEAFADAMPDGRIVDPVPARAIDLLISVAMQTGATVTASPAVSASDLADLPLFEVPSAKTGDDRLAIIMTGDGGWAEIDRTIGQDLAAKGIAVVGFSTLKYFWKEQTPEHAAEDLQRVIAHYTEAWGRKRVVLIGYSFGAGVLPFLIPRLPPDSQAKVALVALLAPPAHADFEISVGGWIGQDSDDGPEVAPAMQALSSPILCIRSEEEDDSPCPPAGKDGIQTQVLKGDHHFNGAYAGIAQQILDKSTPLSSGRR